MNNEMDSKPSELGYSLHEAPNLDTEDKRRDAKAIQIMQISLARETVQQMRKDAGLNKPISIGFGKHIYLKFGRSRTLLKARTLSHTQEIYCASTNEASNLMYEGSVSHNLLIDEVDYQNGMEDSEALHKLKTKFASLAKEKEDSKVTLVDEVKAPPQRGKANSVQNPRARPLNSHQLSSSRATAINTYSTKASSIPGVRSFPTTSQTGTNVYQAQRFVLFHILAIRPASESLIARKTGISDSDCSRLIQQYGEKVPSGGTEHQLARRWFKEIDVWRFPYPCDEDRQSAIENAIRAFDQQRISPTDEIWQKLLPVGERGKGTILSKLKLGLQKSRPIQQPKLPTDHRKTLGAALGGGETSKTSVKSDETGKRQGNLSGLSSNETTGPAKTSSTIKKSKEKKDSFSKKTTLSKKPEANLKYKSAEFVHSSSSDEADPAEETKSDIEKKAAGDKKMKSSANDGKDRKVDSAESQKSGSRAKPTVDEKKDEILKLKADLNSAVTNLPDDRRVGAREAATGNKSNYGIGKLNVMKGKAPQVEEKKNGKKKVVGETKPVKRVKDENPPRPVWGSESEGTSDVEEALAAISDDKLKNNKKPAQKKRGKETKIEGSTVMKKAAFDKRDQVKHHSSSGLSSPPTDNVDHQNVDAKSHTKVREPSAKALSFGPVKVSGKRGAGSGNSNVENIPKPPAQKPSVNHSSPTKDENKQPVGRTSPSQNTLQTPHSTASVSRKRTQSDINGSSRTSTSPISFEHSFKKQRMEPHSYNNASIPPESPLKGPYNENHSTEIAAPAKHDVSEEKLSELQHEDSSRLKESLKSAMTKYLEARLNYEKTADGSSEKRDQLPKLWRLYRKVDYLQRESIEQNHELGLSELLALITDDFTWPSSTEGARDVAKQILEVIESPPTETSYNEPSTSATNWPQPGMQSAHEETLQSKTENTQSTASDLTLLHVAMQQTIQAHSDRDAVAAAERAASTSEPLSRRQTLDQYARFHSNYKLYTRANNALRARPTWPWSIPAEDYRLDSERFKRLCTQRAELIHSFRSLRADFSRKLTGPVSVRDTNRDGSPLGLAYTSREAAEAAMSELKEQLTAWGQRERHAMDQFGATSPEEMRNVWEEAVRLKSKMKELVRCIALVWGMKESARLEDVEMKTVMV